MKKESAASIADRKEVRAILLKEIGMVKANKWLTDKEKETKILKINDLLTERYN